MIEGLAIARMIVEGYRATRTTVGGVWVDYEDGRDEACKDILKMLEYNSEPSCPTDIPSLERWLATRFEIKDGNPSAICECGEEYVAFALGTRPAEAAFDSEKWPVPKNAKELVERALVQAIRVYADDKNGTLYWRVRPHHIDMGAGHWGCYARLVISDRPIVSEKDRQHARDEFFLGAA